MTAQQWCRQEGVSSGSLYRWAAERLTAPAVRRAGKRVQNVDHKRNLQGIAFEQLQPRAAMCAASSASKRSIVLELMLVTGPARIRIDADADLATMKALVGALTAVMKATP
jgi:hypothetical protein